MGFLASRTARVLLALGLLLGAAAAAAGYLFYATFLHDLPELRSLDDYRPPLSSVVVDRKGREIGEFYEYRRRITPLKEVPERVIQAFLAAEDDAFFEHSGIDFVSILRAAWVNLQAGGDSRQGASTITQQMVKQLLLTPERTYTRKIREMVVARRIEQRFSKQEILFLYLNQIYFGAGAYGIGEAARTYFGKAVSDLDVGEAALLAGMPKAPTRYSPFTNPTEGEQRRLWVLGRMQEEGFIDADTRAKHVKQRPALQDPTLQANAIASYFTEEVRRRLVDELGNHAVLQGGLRIETTLDLELQRAAVASLRGGVEQLDHRRGYRGVLRRVATSEIEAEIARLAVENELERPERLTQGPRVGVVVELGAESARVAFAPGAFATLALEATRWAHAAGRGHGAQIAKLGDVLAVGDVASFQVTRDEQSGARAATLYQQPDVQSALLSFELASGDVLALVGGYDFEKSEFDRATQAQRQPGSAFKPFVYATAIARGYTPGSIIYDRPVVVDDGSGRLFRPENYGRRFLGPVPLAEALARSLNNASVHLALDVGIDRVIETAKALGIRSPIERVLSLALGVSPVTLLELTRGYATLGANGRLVEPRFVVRVTDRDGKQLLAALPLDPAAPLAPRSEPVVPPAEAYVTTTLMRAVIEHPNGTGHRAASLGHPIAGKTGTTNDHTDAWFVGTTPEVATGVWVGIDAKQVLGPGETGGRAALPIWIDYMKVALAGHERRDFEVPPGIAMARVGDRFQPLIEGATPRASAAPSGVGEDEAPAIAPTNLDF